MTIPFNQLKAPPPPMYYRILCIRAPCKHVNFKTLKAATNGIVEQKNGHTLTGKFHGEKTILARLHPFRVAGDGYSGSHRQDFVRDSCRRNECDVRAPVEPAIRLRVV